MNERRQIILWVDANIVLTLFQGWRDHKYIFLPRPGCYVDEQGNECPLPVDVRVISIYPDWYRRAFSLLLEHESFAGVPDGAEVPGYYLARNGIVLESRRVIEQTDDCIVVEAPVDTSR